jgi:hypothetical protein
MNGLLLKYQHGSQAYPRDALYSFVIGLENRAFDFGANPPGHPIFPHYFASQANRLVANEEFNTIKEKFVQLEVTEPKSIMKFDFIYHENGARFETWRKSEELCSNNSGVVVVTPDKDFFFALIEGIYLVENPKHSLLFYVKRFKNPVETLLHFTIFEDISFDYQIVLPERVKPLLTFEARSKRFFCHNVHKLKLL